MSNIQTYIEAAMADNTRRKELANSVPVNLGHIENDGTVFNVRELLLTEDIEGTTLIQTEVAKTVLEGTEPKKCMRQAVPVIRVNSNKLDWVYGEAGTYADEVAEGTEIPINTQDYSKRTFTVKKYGTRPLITNELIEDGLFNIVELELRKAGARIENQLNQLSLGTLLDNATSEHDTAGTNQGVKAIAAAAGKIRALNLDPDTVILHPEAEAVIAAEFVPTAFVGAEKVMNTGQLGNVLGLSAYVCSVATPSASHTWDYDADGGDIGMCVIDSKNAGAIAMRRDITIEKYKDPIRDLVGMSVTSRFGVNYLNADAICRVEY